MKKLRVLDLFSGIGGFSLGLERTGGFETVAFCEIEDYPRRVLAKHWPKVPCYHDVRELTADALARDGIAVDVICGGFPCQDISFAGKGAGIAGERSGLWFHYARLIGELRPKYVIVENVAALLSRGLADVLGSLAALRYDAEWHCIPASAVGAPHRRDRLWIVAYPGGQQHQSYRAPISRQIAKELLAADADGESEHDGPVNAEVAIASQPHSHPTRNRRRKGNVTQPRAARGWKASGQPAGICAAVADTDNAGSQGRISEGVRECAGEWTARPSSPFIPNTNEIAVRQQQISERGSGGAPEPGAVGEDMANTNCSDRHGRRSDVQVGRQRFAREAASQHGHAGRAQWFAEPAVRRVAHGVPFRVDRLGGLGNAVVPENVTVLGRAILQAEGMTA